MSSVRAALGHRTNAPSPPPVLDLAIAAAALGGSLTLAFVARGPNALTHSGAGSLDLLGVALVVLATAPVVAWRRAPLGVLAVTASATALLAGLSYPVAFPLGPTAALYLLAASRKETGPWTIRTTVAVVGLFAAYLGAAAATAGAFPGIEFFHTGLAWSVAWFAGERTRLRHEQLAELLARADGAEHSAERERRLAVAEERARIARDLHDSAGHAINVIAILAGAARLRHRQDPDRSFAALEAIEELARQTAGEIDHFVGALRNDHAPDGAVEAPPGLASLDSLVAQHAAAGLDIALDTVGHPRQLGVGADQAAFRILQEALTNAARHGTGVARVELGFGESGLEVVVTNPMPPGSSVRANGGHGLIGMSERANLLGGVLAAETAGNAFRVRALLPYGGRGP